MCFTEYNLHYICIYVYMAEQQTQGAIQEKAKQQPRVKDMVARQLLGSSYHLFSTDDTHIVGSLQVLRSCIRVTKKDQGMF